MMDERTEQLINRQCDGQLQGEESLELDKRLIRSPEARALLEEYQRIDTLAAEALQATLTNTNRPSNKAQPWHPSMQGRSHWRRWYYLAPAVAAAVAVLFFYIPSATQNTMPKTESTPIVENRPTPQPDTPLQAANDALADDTPVQGLTPIRVQNRSSHLPQPLSGDLFGVYDPQTRSVYMLETNPPPDPIVPASANY